MFQNNPFHDVGYIFTNINSFFNSLKDFAGIGISYEYTTAEPKKNPEIDTQELIKTALKEIRG